MRTHTNRSRNRKCHLSVRRFIWLSRYLQEIRSTGEEIIEKLKETLNYWRRFVPEDGIRLDVLLKSYRMNK